MARVTMVTPPASTTRLDSGRRSVRRSPSVLGTSTGATSAAAPGPHPAAVLAGHEEILPPGGGAGGAASSVASAGAAVGAAAGGGGGGGEGSTSVAPIPPPREPPLTRFMWRLAASLDATSPRTLGAGGAAVTALALGLLARRPLPVTPHQALWAFQLGAGAAGAAFLPLAYRLRSANLPRVVTHAALPAWVVIVALPLSFYGLRELLTGHRRPGTTAWSAVWRVYAIMVLWALFAWTNENIIRPHLATASWPEELGLTGPPRGPRVAPPPLSSPSQRRSVGTRAGGGGGARGGAAAATAASATAAAAASAAALRAAASTARRELDALLERRADKVEELSRASEAADTSNKLLERARARLGAAAAEAMEGIAGGGGLDELVVLEGVVTCALRYRDSCREGVGEVEREIGRVEERCERLEAEVTALGGGALQGGEAAATPQVA